MNSIKIPLLALSIITLGSCYKQKYQNIRADYDQLDLQCESLEASYDALYEETRQCKNARDGLEQDLYRTERELQSLCDRFESEVKAQFVPFTMEVGEKGGLKVSPCSANLEVEIFNIDFPRDRVFLKYRVGGDIRFSDPLVYQGVKSDHNSILIQQGLTHPVLLTVDSCDRSICEISCTQIKYDHLSCLNPEMAP